MKATARMPRVADSTDEFIVVDWVVGVGQRVRVGDDLLVVETDKATVTVPSAVTGTVRQLLVALEQTVRTGEPIVEFEVP